VLVLLSVIQWIGFLSSTETTSGVFRVGVARLRCSRQGR